MTTAVTRDAVRQRLARARRRAKVRVARVELWPAQMVQLYLLGYLPLGPADADALGAALAELLDRLPPPSQWPSCLPDGTSALAYRTARF